jgi:osmotically-inducible protein OsmY
MNRSLKKRTETALDELARTYELVREVLIQRLEDVDTEGMRKRGSAYASKLADRIDDIDTKALQRRGYRYAGALRKGMERRVSKEVDRRLNRRSRPRWPIAGLAVVGVALAAVGWTMYDRNRREAMRQRLGEAQSRARERYADLGGVGGAIGKVSGRTNGQDNGLKSRVDEAIAAGGSRPNGVDVSVEGRTVYLRGAVDDPAAVDAAAERIHAVDGVVAVVNLTTGRPSSTAGGGASPAGDTGVKKS